MKTIWMLAAAASLAACAGRGEDDMGAAPDRGDTTAVTTGADTTQWDTTNTGGVGQTAEPGMVPDTTGTTEQYPTTPSATTDTTLGQTGGYPTDTTSTTGGYDTTAVPGADTSSTAVPPSDPGMSTDTSGTSGMSTDSANVDHGATDHNVPTADSTEVGP
jgi:hypothetical protein